MWEGFTPPAQRIMSAAIEEARSLRHGYVGTEHMLLALLRSDEGTVSRVVESLGLTAARAQAGILRLVGAGDDAPANDLPLTPRAKAALELAQRESRAAGQEDVEPRHLMLGIAREGEGVGARLLREADVDVGQLRRELGA